MRALLNTARDKRKGIIPDDTDAFRLFDGEGDGRRGMVIDSFAGHWLVQTKGTRMPDDLYGLGIARSVWWKRLSRGDKEGPKLIEGDAPRMPFEVRENGMRFLVDFKAGYSQGIFLDQRENRALVRELSKQGTKVLNCFAYTCGFSVAAALSGAETTSVDLSGNYLRWGKRNFEANGLDPDAHYFSKGDVFEWLRLFRRKGLRFGGVILDPPTFSRSKKSGVFRVESDYGELVRSAWELVADDGWMLCCANTQRLDAAEFEAAVSQEVMGRTEVAGMPPDFTGESYLKSVWVRR